MSTFTRNLPIPLTAEERLVDYATGMALVRAREAAKERKALVDGEVNAEVKRYDDRLSELAEREKNGYSFGDIECREERDDSTMTVRVWRNDTGELVEERAYTTDEVHELQNPIIPGLSKEPPRYPAPNCMRCGHSRNDHGIPALGHLCSWPGCDCPAFTDTLPARSSTPDVVTWADRQAAPATEPENLAQEAPAPAPKPKKKGKTKLKRKGGDNGVTPET